MEKQDFFQPVPVPLIEKDRSFAAVGAAVRRNRKAICALFYCVLVYAPRNPEFSCQRRQWLKPICNKKARKL